MHAFAISTRHETPGHTAYAWHVGDTGRAHGANRERTYYRTVSREGRARSCDWGGQPCTIHESNDSARFASGAMAREVRWGHSSSSMLRDAASMARRKLRSSSLRCALRALRSWERRITSGLFKRSSGSSN